MKISREPPLVQIMIYQKKLEDMEYLNYVGSIIAKMQVVHVKLNPRLPWQKLLSTEKILSSETNLT
jgi:hypothetical protein